MKALFVHDHIFYTRSDEVLSDKLPYKTFERYLEHFTEVIVIARSKELDDSAKVKIPVASGKGVRFIFLESLTVLGSLTLCSKFHETQIGEQVRSCDRVIARLPSSFGLLAVALSRKFRKPLLIEVVGCYWDAFWNYGGVKAKMFAPLAFLRMRFAVRKSKFVIYVTKEFLQRRYPSLRSARTASLSNVEIQLVHSAILLDRVKRIKEFDKKVVFGFMGSFYNDYKGLKNAISVLGKYSQKDSNIELRILGVGDFDKYRAFAVKCGLSESKIFFDGLLPPGAAVFNWLDGIDIYLHPSFQEGVPRSLIEAMSRGCPALASSTGGIPELLSEENMFEAGNDKRFLELLLLRTRDADWMLAQAQRNFDLSQDYNIEILREKRNVILNNFIAKYV